MIKNYIKNRILTAMLLVGLFLFQLVCFALYGLPAEAVLYPSFLYLIILVIVTIVDFAKYRRKMLHLEQLMTLPEGFLKELEDYNGVLDEAYKRIIEALEKETRTIAAKADGNYSEMVDYYTLWVHQIKTPIASMKLTLQNEDSATARKLSKDLTEIEQYVEMVLCYLRLDSDSTDYVFKEYVLDDVVNGALRKQATQFIGKGLSLQYEPPEISVLTDDKWLSFVVEQVLSNALKYTNTGYVKIFVEEREQLLTLTIEDSGIGIAPEDVPRIFDRGYTGFNGRSDKKASGLGLYLCRRICDNLGLKLWAESEVGKGTMVHIDFPMEKRIHE